VIWMDIGDDLVYGYVYALVHEPSQRVEATITKATTRASWRVMRDGRHYGDYVTEAAARAKAEVVVAERPR
jgi:hypothetical protein